MAEQKCPMCGKLNPPEAEVCQFCEARLKPLVINQPDESELSTSAQPSASQSKEESAPDWLRSLRDNQDEAASESSEEDLLSWSLHEEEESPGQPSGEEIAAPDWLDGLRAPADSDEDTFLDAGQDEDVDKIDQEEEDWLPSGLDSAEEPSIPDWLERIRSRQQDEPPDEDTATEQQDLPDWLRSDDLSTAGSMADWPASIRDRDDEALAEQDQVQPASEPDETLPSWMIEETQERDEVTASAEGSSWPEQGVDEPSHAVSDEIPDWLEGEDAEIPTADEFPEWLETGQLEADETAAEAVQADWIASPARDAGPSAGESIDWFPEEKEVTPTEQIPEWLQPAAEASGSEEELPETSEASFETEAEPSDEIPDWLQQAGRGTEEPRAQETLDRSSEEADEAAPADEMPDWMQPEQEATTPQSTLPDWLAESVTEEDTLEAVPADGSTEDLPGWLTELDQEVAADMVEAAHETGPSAEPAEELPAWLASIEPDAAGVGDESMEEAHEAEAIEAHADASTEMGRDELSAYPEDETFEEEVPDWLADVKASDVGLGSEADRPAEQKEADLAPAELPSWLEAMRPVEAESDPGSLDERDRQVVSAGPLIGLRGVLPAEPEISKVQKPPTYSIKLQVSDMQQERAAMLEEMIRAEGVSRPIPGRPLVSSQNILRMVFALVLLLAILWPLIANGPIAPVPVFTPETAAANQIIGQINSQAPVLMAVDYQPGLSGEMDAISSALFDHLMLRGAYLTLVSTTASGPIQAEHVIELSNQRFGHTYLSAGEYTNLGYIPGGPTGLISFAADPRTMMAYALDDGRPAWQDSPLQNVQNLSDFALVTVITENPETARAWIEQVQPELGDTPLIMAISAQAEPMVRPYYEAFPKQVQGMVVGLAGSVAYESLMGRQGISLEYWNSFGVGLLVAIALIFVGGLFNMVPIIIKGGRENSAEREGSR